MKIKKISDLVDKNFITTIITSYLSIVVIMLIMLISALGIYSRYYVRENEMYNNSIFRSIATASMNSALVFLP